MLDPKWNLRPELIIETVETLSRRIKERFPHSGLSEVCDQLAAIARDATRQAEFISRPIITLRAGVGLLIGLIVLGLVATLVALGVPEEKMDFLSFVQVLEAGINDVVLISIAIFFLVTLERRIKRVRALKAVHELRAMAHIIDMHQLTKDPGRLISNVDPTPSSPPVPLNPRDMIRYLDYCSEMQSLTGKLAAVYVQSLDDAVVLAAANEIESLTTGISRKIWQKIMVAETIGD